MALISLESFFGADGVNQKKKLLVVGSAIGVFFPVLSMCVDLAVHQQPFGFENSYRLFMSTPLHALILGISLFTSLFFYVAAKKIMISQTKLIKKEEKSQEQSNLLQRLIANLDNGEAHISDADKFENKQILLQLNEYKNKLISEKQQEALRLWQSNGMSHFSEILRSTHDVSKLTDEVIKFVVNYTKSNQGSLYIVTDTEADVAPLELKAVYAYNRKKYLTRTIEPGEGLVGQCYLEKESIRLLEVPENYIKITSGLGEATPRSVVLIPLKSEDKVLGVLELASFVEYSSDCIGFLEKVTAALASTIQTVGTNSHVRKLLESSQQQTEELRAQEEEMRQNMEELQAIQEQLSRQLAENDRVKKHLEARENVLGLTTILSESDLFGTITFINKKFCEVSQYSSEELVGKPHNILRHRDMPSEVFRLMWSTIKQGKVFRGIVKNKKKDGTHYWVDATIVPILENGKIVKYIGARYHIEDEVIAEIMFQEQLQRLNIVQSIKIEQLELEDINQ